MKITAQKLIGFARKELNRLGFVETPDDWYEYKHLESKAGLVFVSCKLACRGQKNRLSIFMRFENPTAAIQAGFRCNEHSGKYNFHFNITKNEICYVLSHILPKELQGN